MQNKVPFEFGAGDGQDAGTEGTSVYQPLETFVGQETTRLLFLQQYVAIKAKGHEGSTKVEVDDENAAPVNKMVAVGKKTKIRPHQQVEVHMLLFVIYREAARGKETATRSSLIHF